MNKRFKQFSSDVQKYQSAMGMEPARRDLIRLGKDEAERWVYLRPEHLKTHLMIQAPTGAGKTFIARHIFRSLVPQDAAIYADDPKGDLSQALEEDCAALGQQNRTVLFQAGRGYRLPSYNPLKRNGLEVEDQSLWTLGGIKAGFAQNTFDQTPQMARWLYNAIALAIEGEGTLLDALACLHLEPTAIRSRLMSRTRIPLLRQEWEAYESLPIARRREETASAYARLHRFCNSPTIRSIISRPEQSLDFGQILQEGKILLTCLPRYRPLEPEHVNLLRSLLLQSLLAQAFYYPLGERPPVYIILDEAEHVLERDTGIIETILNEGRSLGIHLILIFHTFAQVAKRNPALLASVLSNCRTKLIGGHLIQEDLKVLTEELFTTDWNPYIVKDELEALELDPVETERIQRSYSRGGQESASLQFGRAYGTAITKGISFQMGSTRGRSSTLSDGETFSSGHSEMYGNTISEGESEREDSRGGTSIGASYSSAGSSTTADTEGISRSSGTASTILRQATKAVAVSLSQTRSRTDSEGVSVTRGSSWQEGVTIVPFYEYEKRMRVSSREFLSLQEFLAEKLNKLKSQKQGHWAISPPEGQTVFFRAVHVRSLLQERKQLDEFRGQVFSDGTYIEPEELEVIIEAQGSVGEQSYTEAEKVVEYQEEDFADG